jgi:hypothetical protein
MCSLNSLMLVVALMHSVLTTVISQESCNVCNCQFNNVQVLDQLIEDKLNTALTGKLIIILLWHTMDHIFFFKITLYIRKLIL